MEPETAVILIGSMVIGAGVLLMVVAMVNRRKMREMEHRERLAMIERGLMPSPESDPGGFEAASGLSREAADSASATGYRTAGVLMIGFGLGLMVLISFAADHPSVGIGIGGAWAVLGAASLLNYFLMVRREELPVRRWAPPPPRSQDPPANFTP